MTIGIMGAMSEEIQHIIAELSDRQDHETSQRTFHTGQLWGKPVVLVFARWGKVAAATTATTLIHRFGVKEILFTGVAGAVDHALSLGDIVVGKHLYQHDLDARPFFSRHEIPLLGVSALPTCSKRRTRLERAVETFLREDLGPVKSEAQKLGINLPNPRLVTSDIASGDKFFAEKSAIHELQSRLPSVSCVEMEGAAVAQVCHEHQIPFSIMRTISDSGDEKAPVDFAAFVNNVASAYSHGVIRHLLQMDEL
jgi:adenosylhomocysteine nucleosidase